MELGRKLDAKIDEKVMEQDKWDVYDNDLVGDPPDNYVQWIRETVPYYSTDIAAAWKVVEKMNSPFVALEYRGGVCVYELWDCQIGGLACSADTMPMAICLAALKFVGRKMEDEIR